MFGVFFSILVVVALVSIFGEIFMRVRLTRSETSGDKPAWWRRGGDEVAATYEELFPDSRPPILQEIRFLALRGLRRRSRPLNAPVEIKLTLPGRP